MMKIKVIAKKCVANMAKKAAVMEANTACPLYNYQAQEPQSVKKLRKF